MMTNLFAASVGSLVMTRPAQDPVPRRACLTLAAPEDSVGPCAAGLTSGPEQMITKKVQPYYTCPYKDMIFLRNQSRIRYLCGAKRGINVTVCHQIPMKQYFERTSSKAPFFICHHCVRSLMGNSAESFSERETEIVSLISKGGLSLNRVGTRYHILAMPEAAIEKDLNFRDSVSEDLECLPNSLKQLICEFHVTASESSVNWNYYNSNESLAPMLNFMEFYKSVFG